MELAIDDQHRAGLRRVEGLDAGRREGFALHDPGFARAKIEDAVRQQMEIAPSLVCVDSLHFATVFDEEADGRLIVEIHAAVHCKAHVDAILTQIVFQRPEGTVRPTAAIVLKNLDIVAGRIEAADGIAIAEMLNLAAAFAGRRGGGAGKNGKDDHQSNQAHSSA